MILTQKVEVKPNSKTLKHYRNLGYDCNLHSNLIIDVKHLTRGSHSIIEVKCDFCGEVKKLDYNSYWRNTKGITLPYACSEKCSIEKRNINNFNKYGVENVFQSDIIKEKIKQSYLKNLNVSHPSRSKDIQNHIKNTNLLKYGSTCALLNVDIKTKFESTCLKKYGVKNPLQSKISYQSKKNKIIEKYKNVGLFEIKEKKYLVKCNENHISEIDKNIFYNRLKLKTILCTICNPIGDYHRSGLEVELSEFIKNSYNGVIELNKKFGYKEIDIYLPELFLAFEFNGLFWHNELNKSRVYHQEKTDFCESMNIKLIHIYEDDWLYKNEIVKSKILNLIGESDKIYDSLCQIKEVNDNSLIKNFLEENHIQGFIGSQIKIGLFHNNELVSLMTFGSKRRENIMNTYEILRSCDKLHTTVIGGSSKLLQFFIEKYKPHELITVVNRSWSSGSLYKKLGFKLIHKTSPDFYYVNDRKKYHKLNYKKDKLVKEGFDKNKTEHEIMLERKIYRIYDSGSLKYSLIVH